MMNRIELKQEAKGVVRTAAVSAYLFALLYLALTELLQGASVYVNGDVALYMQTYFPNVPISSPRRTPRWYSTQPPCSSTRSSQHTTATSVTTVVGRATG